MDVVDFVACQVVEDARTPISCNDNLIADSVRSAAEFHGNTRMIDINQIKIIIVIGDDKFNKIVASIHEVNKVLIIYLLKELFISPRITESEGESLLYILVWIEVRGNADLGACKLAEH